MAAKMPEVTPFSKCKLRMLKLERIKDYLTMEQEFITSQEKSLDRTKEEAHEEERNKVDELRGTPMVVGSLEEIIDDSHAIVSSSVGPEYYVSILSIVDKDQLEPGCSILLHNKVRLNLLFLIILTHELERSLLFLVFYKMKQIHSLMS